LLKFKWETKLKEVDFGEVPYDWEERVLYDLAEWINGYPFAQKTLNVEQIGLPVIKIAELNDGIKESTQYYNGESEPIYVLEKGDLLFAWSASVGVYIWRGSQALLNQHIFKVLPKIDKRFLYFLLRELNFIFQSIVEDKATTMGHVTIEDLKRIKTYLPSSPEQSRIATILSWLDDLIENKIRQNEILENIAMAIFKSWFIDFQPFKNSEFVPSEVREIPKGWEVKELGNVVKFLYGEGLPERRRQEGPYPVVGSSGIIGYHSKNLVSAPSIIVGRKGNAGSVHLMLEPSFPIDTVFYSADDTPSEMIFYIYHFLQMAYLQDVGLSDTAVPGLSIHTLNSIKVLIPPQLILEKFCHIVVPLLKKAFLNKKQILSLSKVRDTLLPLLVFGKLRVEEI
jgi:type I restriction enzyme S subunit